MNFSILEDASPSAWKEPEFSVMVVLRLSLKKLTLTSGATALGSVSPANSVSSSMGASFN
jgi:hypothetical protein